VDLDATAVDEQSVGSIAGSRKRAEDAFPYASLGPADEAVVEGFLRSIDVGAIRPAPAAAKRMNNPAQHPAIVCTLLAAHVGWQQRRNPCPLHIGKPKEIRHLTASSPRQ
jgi:hypothetical protein